MPAKLKAALKGLGYAAFFFVALLLFVYATLPLDALESYMVRKASDEYGVDLEIAEMSMWGISGLSMEGVTVTPRPTPEEIVEMRDAREARAAWQARQTAKAADGADTTGAAGPGAADTPTPPAGPGGKPDPAPAGPGAKPGDKADAPPAGPGGKPTTGPTTAASDSKASDSKADDKPPPVPAGPQPLFIESLRAQVALGKLISDLTDGRLLNEDAEAALEARLLGGTIDARVEKNSETTHLVATFAGLDLQQLTVLRALLPLPVVGQFEGEVDLEVPMDDDGQFRLASAAGHLSLSLSNAVLGPGRIESDGLRNFGGFFDVPRLTLAEFGGKINFERRRAVFDDFAFRGKDLEGDITGFVQLANKLERFNPRAYVRFKFAEQFLAREKGIGVLMRTVPEIKRGTGGDGFTGFAVSMKTDPKSRKKSLSWRPTPRNPYGPRSTVRDTSPPKPATVRGGRDALRDRKSTNRPSLPARTGTSRPPVRRPSALGRKAIDPIEPPDDTAEPEEEPAEPEEEPEEETTDEPKGDDGDEGGEDEGDETE